MDLLAIVLIIYIYSYNPVFISEVEKAVSALNGRFFGGRLLTAEKYDQEMFIANDLSG